MQDGDSIKGKDEAKRGTIEQAHLLRDTRKHVFLVSNSDTKAKARTHTELQPNMIY